MQRRIGMRAGIFVLILIIVSVHFVSAATTYNDPQGRFAFTVPDSYIQRYRAGTDVSFRPADTKTSSLEVTVVAQAPGPIPTADTIVINMLNSLSSPAYTLGITGVQSTILGGQPARRFDYYTAAAGMPVRTHTLQFVAITGKAAYALALSANEGDYDQLLGDAAIVLGSFSFTGTVSAGGTGSVVAGSSATTGPAVVPAIASGAPQPDQTPSGIASGVAAPATYPAALPTNSIATVTVTVSTTITTGVITGTIPAVTTATPITAVTATTAITATTPARTRTPVG